MIGELEQKLKRIAARVGWRLWWRITPSRAYPGQVAAELDIFEGKRLVTRDGYVWAIGVGRDAEAQARESVARMVLAALPRRGAGPA